MSASVCEDPCRCGIGAAPRLTTWRTASARVGTRLTSLRYISSAGKRIVRCGSSVNGSPVRNEPSPYPHLFLPPPRPREKEFLLRAERDCLGPLADFNYLGAALRCIARPVVHHPPAFAWFVGLVGVVVAFGEERAALVAGLRRIFEDVCECRFCYLAGIRTTSPPPKPGRTNGTRAR